MRKIISNLVDRLIGWAELQKPDYVIGREDKPYLLRKYLIPKNRLFNIYLHKFLRSDSDVLHDHGWSNCSIILRGSYVEHTIAAGGIHYRKTRNAGDVVFRLLGHWAHRIEISDPCWTIFVTGPKYREWGFHCPNGWVHWQKFCDPSDSGKVGAGCGGAESVDP